ncbi:ThiF family adenylyltransferase [Promethearchaeum syntrophicum]|uniref:ThiF family adenylyltransferase n=1 Tax=Promethearchaeum syntrophicum TaxID=2594042 RepID=A0A5B9DGP1_9ARCH|nr:HesA/MoeB/ThiF family protein [Candidatus Prometheoarchaeum syntrophicum]QEE17827.1 putative adenylyltransferase [Candidatus Prometheoarchaeum syntrophicum]
MRISNLTRFKLKKFNLSSDQISRYSRQIILKEIGAKGMRKLLNARVLVIGAGGLGCPAVQILSASGVGNIRIVDGDKVEISNLSRQIMHYTSDIGKLKVESLESKINLMNPDVSVEIINEFANKSNIKRLLEDCDFVIEASDNFGTKFLINDACTHFKIPYSIAGVVQFFGQILSVIPGETTCYRCIFSKYTGEDSNNTCSALGVIGTVPVIAGTLQANEAIKSILGLPLKFTNGFFFFNLMENTFEFVNIKKNPSCPVCSNPDEPFYLKNQYTDEFDECKIK